MPVHRVLISELEEVVAEIEKHEQIVSTAEAGDGAVLVFTEWRPTIRKAPGEKETR